MEEATETPPVPPEDHGGDVRIGWRIAGGLSVLAGWGGAVVLNLLAHQYAPAGGSMWGPIWVGPTVGSYAWAVFGIGIGVGIFGVVMLYLAGRAPRGPFVLPGYSY